MEVGRARDGRDAALVERDQWILPAAVLPFLLTLGTAVLGLALIHHGLAVVWPAAGMVAGLWLIAPRRLRPIVLASMAAGLATGQLLAGRPLLVNLLFVAANLGEAWLLGALLERWIGRPVRLESLRQVIVFLCAVAIAVSAGGVLGTWLLLGATDSNAGYGESLWLWVRSRGIGMLTVAPAVIALGSLTRATWPSRVRAGRHALAGMLALGLAAWLVVEIQFAVGDLLSLLALLTVVYPLLLWIAAANEPAWSYLALLELTLLVVWNMGQVGSLFRHDVDVAQAFLFVSSFWSLTLAVVMDRQRRAMAEARRNEASMRHALAAGRCFTFDWDPETDAVRRADPNGIVAPFVEETSVSYFARLPPDDRERLRAAIASLTPSSTTYETTYVSRRPDGRYVWLEEHGIGDFDESGRLVRLQGLTTDVTLRREAEEALREADRNKDRFIATLAHELRNPLAPIRTAAELLGSTRAGAAEVDWARRVIQRQVRHMALLLDDLLDVARITRGKLSIRPRLMTLDEAVEPAIEVARPLLDARRQRLVVELPQPAPALEADPLRLAQVISNLLTNAAKYSEAGREVTLRAHVDGDVLELQVVDDGMGLAPESLKAVFEVFTQVQGAGPRSEGGLGIGLSLVKGLVELHGGSVRADSEGVGRGSTFTVRLPGVRTGTSALPGTRTACAATPGTAQRRVLVVDDNRDAADSLSVLLTLQGHEVRVAYGGREGLDAAREFRPDAAVLDLGMPDMDGYDLARGIRADPALADVRLVALTGWGQDSHQARALAAGFDEHLTKPVDAFRLAELLFPAA